MSDKIVYVHPSHTAKSTTIITPKELDVLLESDDWVVKDKIQKKIDGKMVEVYHLCKPSKNRGLTYGSGGVRGPKNDMGLAIRTQTGERGMALSNNNSFLGDSDFNGLPGIQVATSKLISHAYSMGADAANTGKTVSACPWKPGNVAATEWLKGFAAANRARGGGAAQEPDTAEAFEAGKLSGRGEKDLEVHCPYPSGTPHYDAWIEGFKESGGRVE